MTCNSTPSQQPALVNPVPPPKLKLIDINGVQISPPKPLLCKSAQKKRYLASHRDSIRKYKKELKKERKKLKKFKAKWKGPKKKASNLSQESTSSILKWQKKICLRYEKASRGSEEYSEEQKTNVKSGKKMKNQRKGLAFKEVYKRMNFIFQAAVFWQKTFLNLISNSFSGSSDSSVRKSTELTPSYGRWV